MSSNTPQIPSVYNFNPRDISPRQIKIIASLKQSIISVTDLPLGKVKPDFKLTSKCKSQYHLYNVCLQITAFDRQECRNRQKQVIQCENRQCQFPSNQQIIKRLRQGLQRAKQRKKERQQQLAQKYGYNKK